MLQNACHYLLEHLSDYVDGELDETLCQELEQHMESCENCRIVVNTLERTILLYRDLPEDNLPKDVKRRLYASMNLEQFLHEQKEAE